MEHVIRMADKQCVAVLAGNPEERDHLEDLGVNEKILYLKVGWFRTGTSGRSLRTR